MPWKRVGPDDGTIGGPAMQRNAAEKTRRERLVTGAQPSPLARPRQRHAPRRPNRRGRPPALGKEALFWLAPCLPPLSTRADDTIFQCTPKKKA